MTAERWERVARVYQAALDRSPAARSTFVADASEGDEELRRDVESLLAQEAEDSPLDSSVWDVANGLLDEGPDLPSGSWLGPYRIDGVLGAGGMGDVYRATDTRLDRTVAIKVLPQAFSGERKLRERFEREAKAIASLGHPHICALYDVGREHVRPGSSDEPVDFLVLEHLEGETLAARLRRGALPASQALRYAIEIADALAAAHLRGVVHRDLKPGNIMITESGAKLLDFGLATQEVRSPHSTELTVDGAILGTFQYMAPEQLEGRRADRRTDIFAFGAVISEMFTGRKAFDPSARDQPLAPPLLDHIVRRCLARDPDERWQSAADLTRELQRAAETPDRTTRRRAGVPAVVAGLAVVLALAAGAALWYLRRAPSVEHMYRVSVVLPEGTSVIPIGPTSRFALSPDGRRLAFVASREDGRPRLYVRALDRLQSDELPGTDGAILPFWSPDGRSVGFIAEGALKRIDLDGRRRAQYSVGTAGALRGATTGRYL